MTTTLDHQAATTPSRLRLPAALVAELERIAADRGVTVEETAARLLVRVLPEMVAERTERWLRATLSLAYPVDVPAIRVTRSDDGSVVLDAHLPPNAGRPRLTAGAAPHALTNATSVVPRVALPGRDLDREDDSGARPSR